MFKHLAPSMGHGGYIQCYLQGDILSLDHINHR